MKCLLYLTASRLLAAWSALLADGAPALCLTASRYRTPGCFDTGWDEAPTKGRNSWRTAKDEKIQRYSVCKLQRGCGLPGIFSKEGRGGAGWSTARPGSPNAAVPAI